MIGRFRGGLRDHLVLAFIGAFTTWVALLSWKGFAMAWGQFMGPLVTIAIVVALSGAGLRWLRVPGPLLVLAQLVVVGMLVSIQLVGSPLPVGADWDELHLLFSDAMASAQQYSAPVPRGVPPIDPLLIAGGAACMLLVDIVVGTMRRVPLAGLPLLTIYSIPVSMLGRGVSWIVFTLTALGFLLMLFLQESRQIARWGRPLGQDAGSADPSGFGVSNGALRSSASAIGGVATALAIVVPIFIPTFGLHMFSGGFGNGGGDQIKIENPMTDLKRDLVRGQDVPMITIHTKDPNPGYLRVSVLNRFSDNEWSSGDRKVPTEQRALGTMPPIFGLDDNVPRKTYEYSVSITPNFISRWLPTQAPISSIDAEGDWRYDATTMDFLASDKDLDTAGLSYTMTAVVPELSALQMDAATNPTSLINTQLTDLPTDLPPIVDQLATEVTRDQPTRFQKAVALQDFFRDTGGFTYSTDVAPGNGSDALVAFLTEGPDGRTGYCEQFASAMAVMARSIGIPARVAIGFLRPDPLGGGGWLYSAHDLHAWPELYFPGSGWVRFEPTPAQRGTTEPGYTQYSFPPVETSVPTVNPSSQEVGNRPELTEAPGPNASDSAGGGSAGGSIPWRGLLTGAGALLVLAALACVPRLVRRRRREGRLALGPEAVWLELRDTVVDLGLTWPAGRSPRETGSHLVHYFGRPVGLDSDRVPRHGVDVSPEAEHALDRIVSTIELMRYAREREEPGSLRPDAETVLGALAGGVTASARRRADWVPRSLAPSQRPARRRASAVATEELALGGVVDHVG